MSYDSLDLKISDLESLAEDDKKNLMIPGIINNWLSKDTLRKKERCQNWSESLNFLAGNQWIRFAERSAHWEPIPYTDANKVIDRPVTNHLLRWIIVNASGFTCTPSRVVEPNSDAPEDKTAAQVAEIIMTFLWEAQDKDDSYLEAALWALVTGTVFRKSFKRTKLDFIQNGDKKIYLKETDSEIVSPFEISFDGSPSRWRDARIIMQSTCKKLEDIKRQYACEEEGYFPANLEKLLPEEIAENPLAISEGLKNIVDGGGFSNMSGNQGTTMLDDSAVLKEVYIAPTRKYPKGQMLVTASNQVLYRTPVGKASPYYYLDGKVWNPYTYYNLQKLPGSIYGIALAQQLVKIQRRLNSIDALLAYNRKTMAVGRWINPTGNGIEDGSLIGQPGQVSCYEVGPNGAKPELVPGTPLPDQVIKERQMLLQDGDMISLAGDIRSGGNPEGVHTVGQLQILNENQQQSRATQIRAWEVFISRSEQLDLLNFKDCYQAPSAAFIKDIKKYSKDLSQFDWNTFVGSDLRENATVRIERGSTIPRSRILRQDTLIKLLPLGVLGDIMGDPYLHQKFLEEFGLTEMYTQANIDVVYMEKAIELMLKGIYPPTITGVHNPDPQLIVLLRFMKHPKYLEIKPDIKMLFMRKHSELIKELAAASNRVPANSIPIKPGMPGMPQAPQGQGPGAGAPAAPNASINQPRPSPTTAG